MKLVLNSAIAAALCSAVMLTGNLPARAFPIKAYSPGTYTDPGVSDDSIKIGMFAPLSGPGAALGFHGHRLALAWFDMINKMGGIWGRKIEPIVQDDKCDANATLAAAKDLVEQQKVFMLYGGTCSASTVSIRDYVVKGKIPLIVMQSAADAMADPPSEYITAGLTISQHAMGGAAVDFAIRRLNAKKITFIRHDDAYGDWSQDAAEVQAKQSTNGATITVEKIASNITDVTAPVLRTKAAAPDAIILMTYPQPSTLILKRLNELGMSNIPIILSVNGNSNVQTLAKNVAAPAILKNVYLQFSNNDALCEGKQKWVCELYLSKFPEARTDSTFPDNNMPSVVGTAQLLTYALMMAGPNPTREKVTMATRNIWFDNGVTAGPIDVLKNDRLGQRSTIFGKYSDTEKATVELLPGVWTSAWTYQPK